MTGTPERILGVCSLSALGEPESADPARHDQDLDQAVVCASRDCKSNSESSRGDREEEDLGEWTR